MNKLDPEEFYKRLKEYQEAQEKYGSANQGLNPSYPQHPWGTAPCPSCGHCPTCGRSTPAIGTITYGTNSPYPPGNGPFYK